MRLLEIYRGSLPVSGRAFPPVRSSGDPLVDLLSGLEGAGVAGVSRFCNLAIRQITAGKIPPHAQRERITIRYV